MPNIHKRNDRILEVSLNETVVGTLTLLADDRVLFAFDESYIQNNRRPILSQWFKTVTDELKTEERIRGQATLPPFFSNLLPEGHLRDYLANRIQVKPEREFYLLSALGHDLPGAVRVTAPDTIEDTNVERSQGKRDRGEAMRFSLAGIQLKFSAIMEPAGGLTIRTDGSGGSWIAKLPSYSFAQVPETEFAMLTLARMVGIKVPEFKLFPTASIEGLPKDIGEAHGNSLVIQRFDRQSDGSRIHMEDFAQIFGLYPREKYMKASFDRIAYAIFTECGEEDLIEFVRRLAFNIAIGNGDMHVKNWSMIYNDPRKARLAPAYDFVPTVLYLPGDDLGLRLGGCKSFKEIDISHFAKLAQNAHASERLVLNTVRKTLDMISNAWNDSKAELPLQKGMRMSLDKHLEKFLARAKRW